MNCTSATPSHDHSASIHFAHTGPLTRHDTFSGLLRCGGSCLDAAVLPFIALLSMLRSALDLLPNHEGHVYKDGQLHLARSRNHRIAPALGSRPTIN